MKKIVIIIFILISACQVKEDMTNELELGGLEWLIGEWSNIHGESQFYEVWSRLNDSIFFGESYLIMDKDTVFYETMMLEQKGSEILLTPTTMNHNDGNPITFNLISDHSEVYIFENKNHDFPQRIIYNNPKPDSLYAYIEGQENGKYKKVEFPFNRVKN